MVGDEHFGGFLTRKSNDSETAGGDDNKPKSWKEKMEEVIARSKLAKVSQSLIVVC